MKKLIIILLNYYIIIHNVWPKILADPRKKIKKSAVNGRKTSANGPRTIGCAQCSTLNIPNVLHWTFHDRSPAKTYRSRMGWEICHSGFTSRGNKRILIVSEGEQRNPSGHLANRIFQRPKRSKSCHLARHRA